MAKFTVDPQLLEKAAVLVVKPVNEIAVDVEYEARQLAPPLKVWKTMGDDRVRDPWHVDMEGQERPENLRFHLESHPWDREHRGLGLLTYMRFPKDETSGAVVNIKQCRCKLEVDEDGIRKKIKTEEAKGLGEGKHSKHVVATIVCQGDWVLQAEKGTVYDADGNVKLVARGDRFMEKAARKVRNKRNRVPGSRKRF